jgi:hypothetical protein
MLFASWLRRLTTGSPTRSPRPVAGPTARLSVLPRLEVLEDRTVPSTLTVQNNFDSGPGSLRATIAAAHNGDTIVFANNLDNKTITLTSGELTITASLTIDGLGENELTLSGNNASRVFEIVTGVTVSVDQLTIANGKTVASNGGGILNDLGATLNLDHVLVASNSAYADASGNYGSGGGIENDGRLTVTECTFTNNLASGGGYAAPITGAITEGSAGGAIDSQGLSLTVAKSAFTNNEAVGPSTGTGEGNGGALNTSSPATISNSTFNGNEALGRLTNGGAISAGENEIITAPPMAISNCTFTGNKAVGANGTNNSTELFGGEALGGAMANAGPLSITNSTFNDNLAKGGDQGRNLGGVDPDPVVGEAWGGGIVNFASALTVTNTTFTGNQAIGGNSAGGPGGPAAGGGIASEIFAVTTLTNVTFAGNQAIGGSGGSSNPGYPGTGGSGFGGGFYNGVDSTAMVSDAFFLGNLAQGGSGSRGAVGGVGAGGAIANGGGSGAFEVNFLGLGTDTSSLSLAGSTLILNVAQGGAGGAGANGGNGLGGGCSVLGGTTASIDATSISTNAALGGSAGTAGASGQGIGGGLYIGTGADVTLSKSTDVIFNFASTSNDDIFP